MVIVGGEGVAVDTTYLERVFSGGEVAGVPIPAPLSTLIVS